MRSQAQALAQAQGMIELAKAQAEGSQARFKILNEAEALLDFVGSVDNAEKAQAWLELFYARHPEKKAQAQAKLEALQAKPSSSFLDWAFYGACLLAASFQALSAWYAFQLLGN